MTNFIEEDFLLENSFAKELYERYAKDMPIIDYHCHLPVEDIAEDRQFKNLTEIWIAGDHYKWRAMRALGIEEKYITGNSSDEEKFQKWAETIPYTMRNPLYHWTHLELQRYFGITDLLTEKNAKKIYNQCNSLLATQAYSTRNLLKKMNVKVVCTTDDPADDLKHHKKIAEDGFEVKVLPTFRPDGLLNIENDDFAAYLKRIGNQTKIDIKDFDSLIKAVASRIEYFHQHGCRLSDHGLERMLAEDFSKDEIDNLLKKKLAGENLTVKESDKYQSALLLKLGSLYAAKNWTMQLHLGPVRDTNSKLLNQIGKDAGVDSIGDLNQAKPLAKFLDTLNRNEDLPKTILYNVNPSDNEVMATMAGNFMSDSRKGKIQHGSAWWFLDQKDGMEKQLNSLSNMGLISCFVGMLTDSRSFLSVPRHEYFRRVLCNLFGKDIENKELPEDIEWIGKIIQDICYYNAESYFEFPEMNKK
ncbi:MULTISPECIES: glucuronate isomerase [Salegentibacter]|uniref:Uronate isomerase n=1 Tax=Salegentibacter agarivorans TaxID=345907 RepID=A0A1I2KTU6_9FLAO|nr:MULTISPECIES: glucuronate isomerase [Salegentibacter]APS38666.1 glucuronate isomerase [Salegentibacter sp. T436]SFF69973.1 D-glucuronate isomerase [Salegentibacter agarivorans]